MNFNIKASITPLLLASGLVVAPLRAEEQAAQGWVGTSVSQRLDYGLEAMLETTQRFSSEDRLYRRLELMPQLIWHYSPRYDFGAGYERDWIWDHHGMETENDEGYVFASVLLALKSLKINAQERYQFGEDGREQGGTVWVNMFRQKTALEYDSAHWPLHLKPFADNEFFLDLDDGEITENRARAGLRYPLNEHMNVELYGMRLDEWTTHEGRSLHEATPVAGLNLNLTF